MRNRLLNKGSRTGTVQEQKNFSNVYNLTWVLYVSIKPVMIKILYFNLRYKTSFFVQLMWLLWRSSLGLIRDPFIFKVQVFQTIVNKIFDKKITRFKKFSIHFKFRIFIYFYVYKHEIKVLTQFFLFKTAWKLLTSMLQALYKLFCGVNWLKWVNLTYNTLPLNNILLCSFSLKKKIKIKRKTLILLNTLLRYNLSRSDILRLGLNSNSSTTFGG